MNLTKRNKLFPNDLTLAAQHAQRDTECLACITLAQWALESDYGNLLTGKFNPFGIKDFPGSPYTYTICRTQEYVNGRFVTVEAKFINFPSIEEAFRFHGKLIVNPDNVYADAYPYRNTWVKFIPLMAKHYATDAEYSNKLISLIEQWNLNDFNLPTATLA